MDTDKDTHAAREFYLDQLLLY